MCVLLSVFSPIKTEENPMAAPTSRIFSGFLICSNIRRSSPDSLRIIGTSSLMASFSIICKASEPLSTPKERMKSRTLSSVITVFFPPHVLAVLIFLMASQKRKPDIPLAGYSDIHPCSEEIWQTDTDSLQSPVLPNL